MYEHLRNLRTGNICSIAVVTRPLYSAVKTKLFPKYFFHFETREVKNTGRTLAPENECLVTTRLLQ